jgi:hypothetical protein
VALVVAAPVAHADSTKSVRTHVHRADRALHRVVAHASSGSVSGPLAQLRAQVLAAGNDAAKLYKHGSRAHAARAIEMVAAQQNRDIAGLTSILGGLPGVQQADIAGFIAAATQGRELALGVLQQLLGVLPPSAQSGVAAAVATLSTDGATQIDQLVTQIQPGAIACQAADAFGQIVAMALASVQDSLGRVQTLMGMLPGAAQAQFTGILNGLPAQLKAFEEQIKQAISCPTSGSTGSQTTVPGMPNIGGLVSAVTQFVGSILHGVLPAVSSGATVPSVPMPGLLSGLLGQVTGSVPSIGGLLGQVMGSMPSLGGLLGNFGGFLPTAH